MKKLTIENGMQFDMLTIIEELEKNNKKRVFRCLCKCGKEVIRSLSNLRRRDVNGCSSCSSTKHGMHNTKEYHAWESIIQRCTNKLHPSYDNYGGRGIKVCDRWKNSFKEFIKDMGKAETGMSIDRIDNNKGYYKNNCRWANASQQSLNTRIRIDNKYGEKGIHFDKRRNNWNVVRFFNKKKFAKYGLQTKDEAINISSNLYLLWENANCAAEAIEIIEEYMENRV